MHGAVLQLHKDLEEAAQVGGVSWSKAFRYIVLPLLLPSIVAGWVFVALHALRETTMALMLYSPSSRVISLLMWDTWQSGEVEQRRRHGRRADGRDWPDHPGRAIVDQRRARRCLQAPSRDRTAESPCGSGSFV